MFKVNDVVLVSLLLALNIFHTFFSSASVTAFEHLFVCVKWVKVYNKDYKKIRRKEDSDVILMCLTLTA